MVSPSKALAQVKKASSKNVRAGSKKSKDDNVIDVEAREVKDKPRLGDSTMRADKRNVDDKKTGKRIAGAVAAGTALAAGTAYLADGESGKGTKTTPSALASSRTAETAGLSSRANGGRSAGGKAFDAKFAEMRRAGKDTFTFNGKSYTTRQAGESAEQHKAKMQKIRDKTEEEMQRITTTMARGGMAKKIAVKKPTVKVPSVKKVAIKKITAKKK